MPHISIEGIPPYSGDYPIDFDFSNRELHTIKQISGVRAGEIVEAGLKGDNDLVIALTMIALRRTGQVVNEDLIWDAKAGKITFVADEADAVPPPQQSSDDSEKPSEPTGSSGTSGRNGGDSHPESDPSSIGIPDSATGATSESMTSAT